VYVTYVESVSEWFKGIGNGVNIRIIFKMKHTLMKIRPEIDPQQMVKCVSSICCEYGRNYNVETGSSLAVLLRVH
jgi:hypothetical protein